MIQPLAFLLHRICIYNRTPINIAILWAPTYSRQSAYVLLAVVLQMHPMSNVGRKSLRYENERIRLLILTVKGQSVTTSSKILATRQG